MKRLLGALVLLTATAHADAADTLRLELADAFAKKDMAAIERRVSDPYSGLRWCSNWDDATWQRVSHALKDAKRVPSTSDYRVVLDGRERRMVMTRYDERWVFDLNSLLGPFPHM